MYEIFDPKVDRPLHELPRKEAKEAYDRFLMSIPSRIEQLACLLLKDGIVLDYSAESLKKLNTWFCEIVAEEIEHGNKTPSPELLSLCNDIGMYISEIILRSSDNLHWKFWTKSKKDLLYQRPVITGFNVVNAN
tara:strand:+ start:2384 stop:2785 length:402 start_codon:yes stop_codon:yes gene_type:complete